MAWKRMTDESRLRRLIAVELFKRGVPLSRTADVLGVNLHTAEGWHYGFEAAKTGFMRFDKKSQQALVLAFLRQGYGYKAISRAFGFDLWFVRDTARSFKRGLLDFEGDLHE